MAMQSKMLAYGVKTSSGASVIYTVPTGKTAIVQYSMARWNSGGSSELGMGIRRGGVDVYWHDSAGVSPGQTVMFNVKIHIDAGDSVIYYSGTAGQAQYIVSGLESV